MSIKVCVISPASHLENFSALGDCEMALSHLIVPDAGFHHSEYVKENYVKYYKARAAEGKWTVLDNSAYEIGRLEATQATGKGLGPELVLKAAEMISPSIVIAQDVLCDREATLESTKAFIKYVKDKGMLGKFQLMAVAQGKTREEWLGSYMDLYILPEIDQIGFSKISVPLSFGGNQAEDGCVSIARLKATYAVNEMFRGFNAGLRADMNCQPKPAHLLGGDNFLPWELSEQKKYAWIFSNDSSAAVQYGLHEKKYSASTGKIDSIITKKPDLENNDPSTVDSLASNTDSILHNIAVLHRWSK
jgi:hypothetical protein